MRIAMLLQRTSRYDNRVLREARALAQAGHDVTIVELAPGPREPRAAAGGIKIASALPPPSIKRRIPFDLHRLVSGFAIARAAARLRPDVVHAHDVAMLPSGYLAARLARARLVYDTHEFARGVAYRSRPYALLVRIVETLFAPRADAVVTVSDGIAARLRELYRLRREPVVVRNFPELGVSTGGAGLGIATDGAVVLHQGAPAPDRGCETLVQAVALVDGAHLVFLGAGEPAYMDRLRALAHGSDRIHFLPAREPEALLAATRDADVGVSLLEPVCENHRLALPNKVFEYVAAGVPVVASDLPELRKIVAATGIGVLVDPTDPASVAGGIERALAERATIVEAQGAARDSLSWAAERPRLTALYEELARAQS